jgi:threonine synthase
MATTPLDELRTRVGSTPLIEAKVLGRQLRIPNLFLKDEGANPSGSIHDRLSLLRIEAALQAPPKSLGLTCQDPAGKSLAVFAKAAGVACVIDVPEGADDRWATMAEAAGATVRRPSGSLGALRAAVQGADVSDARALDGDAARRFAAVAPVATEIQSTMRGWPDVLAVPTREGTTVAGLWSGVRSAGTRSKIFPASGTPRIIAATTKMGNPIVWSLAQGFDECKDLDESQVFPSATSEPLATFHARDGNAAVQAVRASNGWGFAAADDELENLAKQLSRTENIEALPAAVAGIAALHFAARFGRLSPTGRHVAVLTARA